MREEIRVRELEGDEGNRLLRIVRRSSGSVVRWRRAQMVLLSAQGIDVAQVAKVAFTSPDRVREACTTSTTTASPRWSPGPVVIAVERGGLRRCRGAVACTGRRRSGSVASRRGVRAEVASAVSPRGRPTRLPRPVHGDVSPQCGHARGGGRASTRSSRRPRRRRVLRRGAISCLPAPCWDPRGKDPGDDRQGSHGMDGSGVGAGCPPLPACVPGGPSRDRHGPR